MKAAHLQVVKTYILRSREERKKKAFLLMHRKSIYCRVIHSHALSSDSDSYLKLVIKLWSCCGIWLKKCVVLSAQSAQNYFLAAGEIKHFPS